MKQFGKRCAALSLALTLIFSLSLPARASWALGSELVEQTVELASGTTLTSQSLWSASKGDLRREHYVTYTPNALVKPVVFSGTYVASTNTVQAAAAQLEAQGWRVAAALNGSFFNTDGTIVGMLMTDGVVRSLDVDNYTLLGFREDGTVFIDESKPSVTAAWTAVETVYPAPPEDGSGTESDPGTETNPDAGTGSEGQTDSPVDPEPVTVAVPHTFPVAGFNAYRNANFLGGLYLYNGDFSSRVSSHRTCVYAILRPLDGNRIRLEGSTLTFEVVSVTDTAREGTVFDGTIPEGCYMLYGEDHDNGELLTALRGMTVGGQVTLTTGGASQQWAGAVYGISGLYTLLRDGQIVDGLSSSAKPQTAVGVKADGTAIFYTIDGRQGGWSIGATYDQVAQRLQELGCVTAVALDGGGSTTLGATLPGSSGFSLVNRPSTANRRINNTILLVSRAEENILTPGAYVTAPQQVVLTGARLSLSAAAYDAAGRPDPGRYLGWTATGGSVSASGDGAVYTAGTQAGTYTVSAAPGGGAMSVRVVDQLSSLTVLREEDAARIAVLYLKPGDRVDLTAAGTWWGLPVAMGDGDVTWSADEAVGVIDAAGLFTAGQSTAEGAITVSAGGKTATIPVKVERDNPFTDIEGHWSEDYVIRLYELGLTNGYGQEDGTALYLPDGQLTRAELLAFVTRLLGVDESAYYTVEMPFADNVTIPNWAQNYVQAMYTLGVLRGSAEEDGLYANVNGYVTREEAMTILGRVLALSQSCDLSGYPDAGSVSDWAAPHVQTLVSMGIVGGSDGLLLPKDHINRAAIAKLLVGVQPLEKALLIPRLDLISYSQNT